jgi:hypothetical protein
MKTLITVMLSLLCLFANSQTDSTQQLTPKPKSMQTVFGDVGKPGWWIGPECAWTKLEDRDGFLVGISGGVIIKHNFSIGLAGYGIVNSNYLKYNDKNDTASVYLYGGYGGLKMEYRLFPMNMVNVAFPLLIGGGGVTFSTWGSDSWQQNHYEDNYSYVWDSYFVLEPGVTVGLNLLRFMRFDIGYSYRFTSDIYLPRTERGLMRNSNVTFGLKFGKF